MERIRDLETYQKVILLLLLALCLIFTICYCIQSSQEGFFYQEKFFRYATEDGNVLYSGIVNGNDAVFRVTPDKIVYYTIDDRLYGPYSASEDKTAIPEKHESNPYVTGIEVRKGEEVIFRGIVHKTGDDSSTYMLIDENGEISGLNFQITAGDGAIVEVDGKVIDQLEPPIGTILKLMDGPQLNKRCQWIGWFLGLFCSATLAASILFADALFRWNLSFHIRDAENAEPTDWEIARRLIGWVAIFIMAIVSYSLGLH